jgi:hypothetical protein
VNVVDSSGWLEYFVDGSNADYFAAGIENIPELIVPSISIYEVFSNACWGSAAKARRFRQSR